MLVASLTLACAAQADVEQAGMVSGAASVIADSNDGARSDRDNRAFVDSGPMTRGDPSGAPVNPVAEPVAWALMILGFSTVGGRLRSRRRSSAAARRLEQRA